MLVEVLQRIIDFVYCFIPYDRPALDKLNKVKIVAHRGVHDNRKTLENTLRSFSLSVDAKLYGIEFDIRWTKDLVPVVHHDDNLERLFQIDQDLYQMNFSDLRQRFPEIPSLSEVVANFGNKIHFFIELKEEVFPQLIQQKEILRQVLSPLREVQDFHLMCLNPEVFYKFDLYSKETYLLIARFNIKKMSEVAIKEKWGGVTGHYFLTPNQTISAHHYHNQFIGTGFPESMNVFKREIGRDVDFIFTNNPIGLLKKYNMLL